MTSGTGRGASEKRSHCDSHSVLLKSCLHAAERHSSGANRTEESSGRLLERLAERGPMVVRGCYRVLLKLRGPLECAGCHCPISRSLAQ